MKKNHMLFAAVLACMLGFATCPTDAAQGISAQAKDGLLTQGDAARYQTNVVPASNQVKKTSEQFGVPPEKASRRVAFVGNSITRHGPKPSIGWVNDCGMAASSVDKDYVHQCATLLEKDVPGGSYKLINVAGTLERTFMRPEWKPESHFSDLKAFKPDVVVFFFGANVPTTYDQDPKAAARTFGAAVEQLARYVDSGKTEFVISEGFYVRPVLDAEKKAAAARLGAKFVALDDIRRRDDTHGRFNHPGDLGMKLIAERFAEAIRSSCGDRPFSGRKNSFGSSFLCRLSPVVRDSPWRSSTKRGVASCHWYGMASRSSSRQEKML